MIVSERRARRGTRSTPSSSSTGARWCWSTPRGCAAARRSPGTVDYYAQLRSERAAERADVAIVVCDASEGVTSEDLRVAELAMRSGCATVLALNKWDIGRTDLEDAPRAAAQAAAAAAGDHLLGADRAQRRRAARARDRARRPRRRADPDPGAEPLRRRRRRQHAAAGQRGRAPAPLLRGPGRAAPAADRDPGQRPRADLPRLGLPPREPPARGLRARGRPARDRLRPPTRGRKRRTSRRDRGRRRAARPRLQPPPPARAEPAATATPDCRRSPSRRAAAADAPRPGAGPLAGSSAASRGRLGPAALATPGCGALVARSAPAPVRRSSLGRSASSRCSGSSPFRRSLRGSRPTSARPPDDAIALVPADASPTRTSTLDRDTEQYEHGGDSLDGCRRSPSRRSTGCLRGCPARAARARLRRATSIPGSATRPPRGRARGGPAQRRAARCCSRSPTGGAARLPGSRSRRGRRATDATSGVELDRLSPRPRDRYGRRLPRARLAKRRARARSTPTAGPTAPARWPTTDGRAPATPCPTTASPTSTSPRTGIDELLAEPGGAAAQLDTFVDFGASEASRPRWSPTTTASSSTSLASLDPEPRRGPPASSRPSRRSSPRLPSSLPGDRSATSGSAIPATALGSLLDQADAPQPGLAEAFGDLAQAAQAAGGVDLEQDLLPPLGGEARDPRAGSRRGGRQSTVPSLEFLATASTRQAREGAGPPPGARSPRRSSPTGGRRPSSSEQGRRRRRPRACGSRRRSTSPTRSSDGSWSVATDPAGVEQAGRAATAASPATDAFGGRPMASPTRSRRSSSSTSTGWSRWPSGGLAEDPVYATFARRSAGSRRSALAVREPRRALHDARLPEDRGADASSRRAPHRLTRQPGASATVAHR